MLRENVNRPAREHELLADREPVRLPGPKKLGMWVFIAADGAAFLAILAACGYIRAASTHWSQPFLWWPDATIAALMSVILLAGSGSAFAATRTIRAGNAIRPRAGWRWRRSVGYCLASRNGNDGVT